MSQATQEVELLRKAANATTPSERAEAIRQLEEAKSTHHEAAFGGSGWSAEDAVINDTLVPGHVHELLRSAAVDTDWITELEEQYDPRTASQQMVAEASLWYGRVREDVKSYPQEYTEQAKSVGRRLASQYGDIADQAERAFVDEAERLRTTAVRSGIVVEASGADETPPENKGPSQKHFEKTVENRLEAHKDGTNKPEVAAKEASYEDKAADEQDERDEDESPFATTGMIKAAAHEQAGQDLYAFLAATEPGNTPSGNPGVYNDDPAQTNSNRAPVFRELETGSQDVVPVNDPGLGQTDDLTGANATRTGEEDHASKGSFPVHGNKKETTMTQYARCATCGGHGKVAVQQREAVSGLPQIDQIVDPHDNGPAPTAYPADVAFPWTMDPQTDVPNAINQAEEQIAQRNSLSPLQQNRSKQPATRQQSVQSARHQAGGRDNSGWMGDNGGRGPDYPGEQIGQSPVPDSSEGYSDPAYGYGGEQGNRPNKPYGAAEADDYTNNQGQNWQPGQDTHADQGWKETVNSNPALASAASFLEQHRQAYLRAQAGR